MRLLRPTWRNLWRPVSCALASAGMSFALAGCPSPAISPLVGEDPEIETLLGTSEREALRSSPLAAAQRLHQALAQDDFQTAWELLAGATRAALDARGALIDASGRELLEGSSLPASAGAVRRVRFDTLFFGADVVELRAAPTPEEPGGIASVTRDGTVRSLRFLREDGLWRLLVTDL
jgi:hypothetical protein